jgi:hypothetical protein
VTVKDTHRVIDQIFANLNCDEISYRIRITPDKFNYPGFIKWAGQAPSNHEWGDITCPSQGADYHAHIGWTDEKTHIRFQVGFYAHDLREEAIPKKIIYAEDCMAEIGKFFKNDTAQAHIHADFEFKSARQSRFPLPLRTTIGACKADVDAIGLRLTETPAGISQIWLMNKKDRDFDVQAYADRKISFATFSIIEEIKELLSVIYALTEEVNP